MPFIILLFYFSIIIFFGKADDDDNDTSRGEAGVCRLVSIRPYSPG